MGARVWIVSFSERREWARAWVEDTCQEYPFLLDTGRVLYHSLGLDRSLLRSWNLRTLLRYARYLLSGRGLEPIRGDSAQLGGDFVFDANGVLRYAHRSQDPVDRPDVEELMGALRAAAIDSAG